jgi:type I restriction enzyme S subunit
VTREAALSGKYMAYPEYNESGVQMLGAIPSSWQTKQVRYLLKDGAEGIKIGPFGSALKLEDMVESGTRVYGQENVIKKDFTLGKRRISQDKFKEMNVYQVYPDDLLITMMGTSGKCELVPQDADVGIIDSHLLRVRVKEADILPRYFRLLIDECHEIENQIKISGKGSIMHGLNSSIVKSLILPLPSPSEQDVILNFLDHETAKIDTLIEKQQQLIKLLKEKRQAVISHAVTKGLDPNAPMRDSGVEWLGEVPEHWTISQVGHCAFVTKLTGFEYTNLWRIDEEGEVIALRGFNVKERKLELNDVERISAELSAILVRSKLAKGDIVFPCTGTIGNAAMIEEDGRFHINQNIAKIRFDETVSSKFAIYWFTSSFIRTLIDRNNTSGMQPVVLIGDIRKLPIPRFDYHEQEAIADYLDSMVDRFNVLISNAVTAIGLMKERRTALISAAVTGKIDVRLFNSEDGKASSSSNRNKEAAA